MCISCQSKHCPFYSKPCTVHDDESKPLVHNAIFMQRQIAKKGHIFYLLSKVFKDKVQLVCLIVLFFFFFSHLLPTETTPETH